MKKTLLIAVFCLLFAAGVRAADPYAGIAAGINIANIKNNDNGTIMRFNAGVFGGLKFGRYFALQGELLYSCVGTNIQQPKEEDDIHLNLNYITIPIKAKFFITRKMNVFAGGQVGFLVSKKFNDHGEKTQVKFDANRVDFSVPIGIGFDFNHFMISGSYQLGAVNVFKNDAPYGTGRNSVVSINFGYKIFQNR